MNDDPLLCATVAAPTMGEMRSARDATDADLIELRLDRVDHPDVAAALDGRRRPVIVTCRAQWEGGGFRGSEEERLRILEAALAGGAEYIDIEAAAGFTTNWDKLVVNALASFGMVYSHAPIELCLSYTAFTILSFPISPAARSSLALAYPMLLTR